MKPFMETVENGLIFGAVSIPEKFSKISSDNKYTKST